MSDNYYNSPYKQEANDILQERGQSVLKEIRFFCREQKMFSVIVLNFV